MLAAKWKDMREFLEFLEEKEDIKHITREVDPEWEVNGITRKLLQEKGPAVIFERVKGNDFPLVAGMLAADRRFLWSLGIKDWSRFNEEWVERTEKLMPTKTVSKGPCKERILTGNEVDLRKISTVKWHQHDGMPFIGTLTVSVTKDPETGWINAGIYRMALLDRNQTGWGCPEYAHGRWHYQKYEEQGEDMPMACTTGYDPTIEIAGSTRTPPGVNEFELAGALRKEPVEMVKCETIDIEVPATSEFVFEGKVPPKMRKEEGPFGEYTGYYGSARTNPFYHITTITHREDAMYLGTREQWIPSESALTVGKSSQAEAFKILRKLVPGLLDLRCDVTYEAIAKIKKMFKGHPQQVMDAIWGATYARYKHIIIVDEDVDIWNYDSVHWALSTRVKASRDVYILPRRAGQWLDAAIPLRERGWQDGLGIDATRPTEEYEFYGEKFPDTVADPEIVKKVEKKWKEYGLT